MLQATIIESAIHRHMLFREDGMAYCLNKALNFNSFPTCIWLMIKNDSDNRSFIRNDRSVPSTVISGVLQ